MRAVGRLVNFYILYRPDCNTINTIKGTKLNVNRERRGFEEADYYVSLLTKSNKKWEC
jgi:hypothetical protein